MLITFLYNKDKLSSRTHIQALNIHTEITAHYKLAYIDIAENKILEIFQVS